MAAWLSAVACVNPDFCLYIILKADKTAGAANKMIGALDVHQMNIHIDWTETGAIQ